LLITTNHKDIGTLYGILGLWGSLVGSSLSFIIRISTSKSGLITTSFFYNAVIRSHALVIIFFFVIPILIGAFGNWMIPLMLGAPDLCFPRVNRNSY
jgi:heme/copper-type cytochrome/quinol oxidase subunit 1